MHGETYDLRFADKVERLASIEQRMRKERAGGYLGDAGLAEYVNALSGLTLAVMEVVERLADKEDKQTSAVVPAPTLHELQGEIGGWAADTFPGQSAQTIMQHLKEEVGELGWSLAQPPEFGTESIANELADIAILAIVLAHHHGINLEPAIRRKHAINTGRTWIADAHGVHHHVKEA